MQKIRLTLAVALALSIQPALADSFTYNQVRKDYIYDDGFGIPHSKVEKQNGQVEVTPEQIVIDGEVYTLDERGKYRNSRGRAVDLTLDYAGATLKNIRISTGHIVRQYDLKAADPAANVASK